MRSESVEPGLAALLLVGATALSASSQTAKAATVTIGGEVLFVKSVKSAPLFLQLLALDASGKEYRGARTGSVTNADLVMR